MWLCMDAHICLHVLMCGWGNKCLCLLMCVYVRVYTSPGLCYYLYACFAHSQTIFSYAVRSTVAHVWAGPKGTW